MSYAAESGRLKPLARVPRHLWRRPAPSGDGDGARQGKRSEKTKLTMEEVKGREARQKRDSGSFQSGPCWIDEGIHGPKGLCHLWRLVLQLGEHLGVRTLQAFPGGLLIFCRRHPSENRSAKGEAAVRQGKPGPVICGEDQRLPS